MLFAKKNAAAATARTRVPKLLFRHAWFLVAAVSFMLGSLNLCWADEESTGEEEGPEESPREEEGPEESPRRSHSAKVLVSEEDGDGDRVDRNPFDAFGMFRQPERKYPPGRLGTLCKDHEDSLSSSRNGFGYYGGMNWYPDTNNIPENCTSATENARGTYTAHKADCIFSFHKVKRPTTWTEYSLSTDCKDSNLLRQETKDGKAEGAPKSFKMKAEAFPDQCVKDYKRCYSIDEDWKHYLSFFCKNEKSIPDDATHLSVDCTEDFAIKLGLLSKMLSRNGTSEDEGRKEHTNSRKDPARSRNAQVS
jgi:hypothetical protein